MTPQEFFWRHGLSPEGLEPASEGYINQTFVTPQHVLRIAKFDWVDHSFESQVALHALQVGVHTARPLFWQKDYSILERLPGHTPADGDPVDWASMLDDLERLHQHAPAFSPKPQDLFWSKDPAIITQTQAAADWNDAERAALHDLLATPQRVKHPVFIHGDAWRANLMIDAKGYVGLLDWGNAGWGSREQECALMEKAAFELALVRWAVWLEPSLVWKIRTAMLLEVAQYGRLPYENVRSGLQSWLSLQNKG